MWIVDYIENQTSYFEKRVKQTCNYNSFTTKDIGGHLIANEEIMKKLFESQKDQAL